MSMVLQWRAEGLQDRDVTHEAIRLRAN